MKLYYSTGSPFVRKVMVAALELGLGDRIERVLATPSPLRVTPDLATHSPLMKIPILVTDDGLGLFDSRLVCEYLDSLHTGTKLVPSGPERWHVLRLQAMADGLLDAAILCRYETTMRPEDKRWPEWIAGQTGKAHQALDAMAKEPALRYPGVNLGQIAAACALGWIDFRRPVGDVRPKWPELYAWHDQFATRASMQATAPKA